MQIGLWQMSFDFNQGDRTEFRNRIMEEQLTLLQAQGQEWTYFHAVLLVCASRERVSPSLQCSCSAGLATLFGITVCCAWHWHYITVLVLWHYTSAVLLQPQLRLHSLFLLSNLVSRSFPSSCWNFVQELIFLTPQRCDSCVYSVIHRLDGCAAHSSVTIEPQAHLRLLGVLAKAVNSAPALRSYSELRKPGVHPELICVCH